MGKADYENVKKATLGRLPTYLNCINSLPQTEVYVSSAEIARTLDFGEVQVRKDFSSIGITGKPKVGFDRAELVARLKDFLSAPSSATVLVGVGKLGSAILDYAGFEKFGLSISAAFDKDESKLGKSVGGKHVLPFGDLKAYCAENNVKTGVITVPAANAQEVCDALTASGVKYIWNFAPIKLKVGDDITVQQEDMALSLAFLSLKLKANN